MTLRSLAYAKQVEARIAAGDRIGLLIVSLHCWRSGDWFEGRDDVCRVVLPADLEVDRADWSIALARDVVAGVGSHAHSLLFLYSGTTPRNAAVA